MLVYLCQCCVYFIKVVEKLWCKDPAHLKEFIARNRMRHSHRVLALIALQQIVDEIAVALTICLQFSLQSQPLLPITVQTLDGNGSKGCLGALDGTFIDVRVPEHKKGRYHTHKGNYYLCDNRYANADGFLTPYRGLFRQTPSKLTPRLQSGRLHLPFRKWLARNPTYASATD
ncbi:hypothetical protein Sango_1172700 [Sesamum angolense]|uniref:DDE Tnp4 domain-containing protein n=1 Tax=Sesamum angolense TaxID=2727404 RepID=A0AAE1WWF8_9LAMI|nr:hypothetical protein Sango_1172700 [Sesamum angolense]